MKANRVLFALGVLGVVLTFGTLGRKSVWLDEAVSIRSAQRAVPEIWNSGNDQPSGYSLPLRAAWRDSARSTEPAGRTSATIWIQPRDPHPPGYYLLLHAWPWRDGSEASIRLLSALAGAASVALAFFVARGWGRGAGWMAAVLVAWAPLHVWYAQEARMYAFVEFAGLVMALGLSLQSRAGFALFAAGVAIGVYFDYTAAIVWAVVSGVWLGWLLAMRQGASRLPHWLLASIVGAALAWPLQSGFLEVLGPSLRSTVFGDRLASLLGPLLTQGFVPVALVVAIGATALIAWCISKQSNHPATAWTVVAIFAAVTAASVAPRLFTLKKLIAPSWPMAALAVAALVPALRGRARFAIWSVVSVSVLATSWMVLAVPKDDWRGLVTHLNGSARAGGDVVWLDPWWDVVAYDFYDPAITPASGGSQALAEAARGQGMLWLVVQRRPGSSLPASPSEAWLDAHLPLEQRAAFSRLELKGYRRTP